MGMAISCTSNDMHLQRHHAAQPDYNLANAWSNSVIVLS
jgi:hypothetical protein